MLAVFTQFYLIYFTRQCGKLEQVHCQIRTVCCSPLHEHFLTSLALMERCYSPQIISHCLNSTVSLIRHRDLQDLSLSLQRQSSVTLDSAWFQPRSACVIHEDQCVIFMWISACYQFTVAAGVLTVTNSFLANTILYNQPKEKYYYLEEYANKNRKQ